MVAFSQNVRSISRATTSARKSSNAIGTQLLHALSPLAHGRGLIEIGFLPTKRAWTDAEINVFREPIDRLEHFRQGRASFENAVRPQRRCFENSSQQPAYPEVFFHD